MTTFVNRTISENGTVTIDYSFATVVARCSTKSQDTVHYTFELYIPKKNDERAYPVLLNSYYLSLQNEWELLSGIEEAARSALEAYRNCFKRKVEQLNDILAK